MHAVGAGQADEVVAATGRAARAGERRDADRRASRRPRRPSSRSRAARPLACARARVTATRAPVERPRLEPGELVAQRGDRADDGDRRRADRRVRRGVARRSSASVATHGALAGQRAALDDRRRLVGRAPAGDELRGDPRQRGARPCRRRACPGSAASAGQSSAVARLGRVLVAGDEGDGAGQVAVRDRDARVGGRGDPGGDARARPRRHARGAQRLGLLAAAPEHERVAALQPHHAPARRARARRAAGRSPPAGTAAPPPSLPT